MQLLEMKAEPYVNFLCPVVQAKSGKVGNQFTYGIKACCMGP